MGEMADYYLESMEYSCELYFSNVMYDDETDTYEGTGVRKEKECKYCGQKQLYWQQTNHGWRLSTLDGKIHSCERRK